MFPKYVPSELDPRKLTGKKPPMIYGTASLGKWRSDLKEAIKLYVITISLSLFQPRRSHHTWKAQI